MMTGGPGSLGPAWTRGEMERPAGQRNMGTWTAAVYTAEQQRRLGVDEMGRPSAGTLSPRTENAAVEALRTTRQVIAALRAELGLVSQPSSPGEVGAWFDDLPIPAPKPIERDIDEMLLAEYERELDESGEALDEGMLVRTESGRLITEAQRLIEESQESLMRLAEEELRQELEMADADVEAWESMGSYTDGFSPRPGWNKLEQAEEFLAEGDLFLEEQRRRGLDGGYDTTESSSWDDDSSDEYEPSPELDPEERDAFLDWQRRNAEFEADAMQFLNSEAQEQQAFDDVAWELQNPSFASVGNGPVDRRALRQPLYRRRTRLNGPVPLGQRARQSAPSSSAVEATALATVQSEIEALRSELFS